MAAILEEQGQDGAEEHLNKSLDGYKRDTLVAADPAAASYRAMLAQAHAGIGASEAKQAKLAPAHSPRMTAHWRKACASYQRALETFRETERLGGALTKTERDDAAVVTQELSSCVH